MRRSIGLQDYRFMMRHRPPGIGNLTTQKDMGDDP
jgi:hypothetical protein